MLRMIKEDGKAFIVDKVPYEKDYDRVREQFTPRQMEKLWHFLDNDITEDNFSVGTKYPKTNKKAWGNGPLKVIYEVCGHDELKAGYFLGQLVFHIIMERDENWFCIKTAITHRDFETLFYFRGKDL